jgi:GDP-D-mannose dehydratase
LAIALEANPGPELAKSALAWEPSVKFKELAEMMIAADLELAESEKRSRG